MKASMSQDSVVNVIQQGIKGDIRSLLNEDRLRGALLLTLAGIDSIAFLGMEEGKEQNERSDYIEWANKYIEFPCPEQVSGLELYASRCGALHAYSTEANLHKKNGCRKIVWMSESTPEVRYEPDVDEQLVLVSIPDLARAFFEGVDDFLIDLFSKDRRAEVAKERFQKVMHTIPVSEN